jgi:hypothetical protein
MLIGGLGFEPITAAVADLSHRPGYVRWHFLQVSWPNLIVVLLMIVVFWLAIGLPFPQRSVTRRESKP